MIIITLDYLRKSTVILTSIIPYILVKVLSLSYFSQLVFWLFIVRISY
jgi:hypothetical protein